MAKVKTSNVSKIYRQQNESHKLAVEALSSGDVKKAFGLLEGMNAIVQVDAKKPNSQIVDDYLGSVKAGKNALVISPTNSHRQELTNDIRKQMRQEGMIGKKEIAVEKLENLYLTQTQKDDWTTYHPGQVIQFVQNTTGIKRGSQWTIKSVAENKIMMADKTGKTEELPQGRTKCFDVLEKSQINLSKGDLVKITRNAFDLEEKRMNNGQTLEVQNVWKDGRIALQSPSSKQVYQLKQDFGHIDHAHCVTSYASQGKTVDEVFIAQPAATFPGTNAKQFYVSVSRAKEGVKIYTDDQKQLLSHAQRDGDRTAALEVAAALKAHGRHIELGQRETPNEPGIQKQPDKPKNESGLSPKIDRDYEPGL